MISPRQSHLFDGSARLQMDESIALTIQSMLAYGPQHDHWAVAWSGGKDSSATLTLLVWLIDAGKIPRPKSLTVFYADTRMELPPLALAARPLIDELQERNIDVRIVTAPLDKRFFVYILGRGVPPPNNNTLRWCTRQIKVEPMQAAVVEMLEQTGGSALMITGVRQGESAIRDRRIEMSCGKDGAECGQGWYQKALPESPQLRDRIATVAPLLHWRVCHVWAWLKHWAPQIEFGDWSTAGIADAYGGDEAEEINARTGCTGCPLAQEERALEVDLGLRGRELSWFEWAGFVRTNDPAIKAVLYVLCAAADAGACFTQRVGNIAHHAGLSTGEAIRALRGMEATGLISGPEDDELAGSTVFVECDDLVATGDLRVDWTFFRTGKPKPPYALSDYLVPAAFSTVARIHG